MCVPDVVKNLNVKVFNLRSRTNEIRHIEWHKTCKCKCRIDGSACNNKQHWNEDKCRCEWKELPDKGVCDKGFIWNPSNCECKCDESCDIEEYLDYENYKFRKKLVNKLFEECTEHVKEKITEISLCENKNKRKCSSCTLYIVLFSLIFTISIRIGIYFVYSHLYFKNYDVRVMLETPYWMKQQFIEFINETS